MLLLFVIGLTSVFFGAVAAGIGLAEGDMNVMSLGLSAATGGLLFIAIDRALTLLSDIRASLLRREAPEAAMPRAASDPRPAATGSLRAAFR